MNNELNVTGTNTKEDDVFDERKYFLFIMRETLLQIYRVTLLIQILKHFFVFIIIITYHAIMIIPSDSKEGMHSCKE